MHATHTFKSKYKPHWGHTLPLFSDLGPLISMQTCFLLAKGEKKHFLPWAFNDHSRESRAV